VSLWGRVNAAERSASDLGSLTPVPDLPVIVAWTAVRDAGDISDGLYAFALIAVNGVEIFLKEATAQTNRVVFSLIYLSTQINFRLKSGTPTHGIPLEI
jgi:hypothetical protein